MVVNGCVKILLTSFYWFSRYSLNITLYMGKYSQSDMTLTFDPYDLKNLISSSMSGTECLCTMWLKFINWFKRYSLNELKIQECIFIPM